MSANPTTRREAVAANLRRYWRETPGDCGHAGEYDVNKGCLTCRRPKRQTARLLAGVWLDCVAQAIETMRPDAPALASFYTTSGKLALITAHIVTKPRRENKPPSRLTVAQEIGKALGVAGQAAEDVGAALLGMALACGFVVLTDGKRDPRRAWIAPLQEVRLSVLAQIQRAQIEKALIESDIPDARPLLERPVVQVKITPNYDDLDQQPPQPIGLAVAEALAPIQNTAWHVNRFMLDTLRALNAYGEALHNDPDKHTAAVAAIEQAAHYANEPEIFYRCNFDWRGRLYQRGGRLQYTGGTDAARSLLEFAHGERLTSDGRLFLGVHVATCHGERGSFADRMNWTEQHREDIARAAADPIGSTWWHAADEPYCFLAACRAWLDVIEDPRAKVHLPVTADGTASAFQHYAWLLRDEELGARVNLGPALLIDTPRDFYNDSRRWSFTREELKNQAWMYYGKVPQTKREHAAQSILRQQAPHARRLYEALRRVAWRKAKAGEPLEWTLPDGFRVSQANRKAESRSTDFWSHNWDGPERLQARRRKLLVPLDPYAQRGGLPPNLIHSLDACLLRAIVLAAGLDRWAVAHDSLGVHPNDGGRLRRAIIEAIEGMYGPDVLRGLGWDLGGVAELPVSLCGGWYTFS